MRKPLPILALLALAAASAQATEYSFIGNGAWSTTANWWAGSKPAVGGSEDDVVFIDKAGASSMSNLDYAPASGYQRIHELYLDAGLSGAPIMLCAHRVSGPTGIYTLPGLISAYGGDIALNNDVLLGSDARIEVGVGNTLTVKGRISGAYGLVVNAAGGTLTLAGVCSYTGVTQIQRGTLSLGADNALPSGARISLTASYPGVLSLGRYRQTIADLDGDSGSTVDLGTGVLTVDRSGSPGGGYLGKITGAGRLVKTGVGTLTLRDVASSSDYTGGTSVQGGMLAVARPIGDYEVTGGTLQVIAANPLRGSLTVGARGGLSNASGSVLVVSGAATLDGTVAGGTGGVRFTGDVAGRGAFSGAVRFERSFSPGGTAAASVAFGNAVILTSTNVLNLGLGGATPGTGHDKLRVTGALTLGGALSVSRIGAFAFVAGQRFDLLDWGSRTGGFSSISLPALAGNLRWNTSALYTDGTVSVQAVPEPASLAVLSLGALALLRRRRA